MCGARAYINPLSLVPQGAGQSLKPNLTIKMNHTYGITLIVFCPRVVNLGKSPGRSPEYLTLKGCNMSHAIAC